MSSDKLPNFLRSNRKRLALFQSDVAYLLGKGGLQQVCRHERFNRIPNLETALSYEVIFQRSVRELFYGLFQRIEGEVAERAKMLFERSNPGISKLNARRRQALDEIAIIKSKSDMH